MKQPEAMRLAEEIESLPSLLAGGRRHIDTAAELRRLHEANQVMLDALKLAVRQNSHDMLMTGEELRKCEAAIAKGEAK